MALRITPGLGRAPLWRVYSPGTLARYAGFALRGRGLHKPVEDTRQMGGEALVVEGRVTRLWRQSTPDDRMKPVIVARPRASSTTADALDAATARHSGARIPPS